jgi:RimJ/RimL family protein N-acetyltransferase
VVVLPERMPGPRTLLRRWTVADVPVLSAVVARNIEHLRPWMPWVADEPLADGDRRALVERWEQSWMTGGDVVLGVFVGHDVVGGAGLHRRRGPHGLEIGYWIDARHTRQGLATEVAAVLTEAALEVEGIGFVEIHHDRRNVASAGVPRRLCYRFMGEAPDSVDAPGEEGVDCTWRMELASWRARRGQPAPHGAPDEPRPGR